MPRPSPPIWSKNEANLSCDFVLFVSFRGRFFVGQIKSKTNHETTRSASTSRNMKVTKAIVLCSPNVLRSNYVGTK